MTPEPSAGRVETVNGAPLYFEVHGKGNPVLLLHGFSGSSQDWMPTIGLWGSRFQTIVPDLRGHGRSGTLRSPFRHKDAASDVLALLDLLQIDVCRGVGVSGGGNVLLHMATRQPGRMKSMVLVSATPYFPEQARAVMRQYAGSLTEPQRGHLRSQHPGGDAQIQALLDSVTAFADSHDDMNLSRSDLSVVQARTLIVQGDRDPLYPLELSTAMAEAIPDARLWVVPGGGHGPVIGEKWDEFVRTAINFLQE